MEKIGAEDHLLQLITAIKHFINKPIKIDFILLYPIDSIIFVINKIHLIIITRHSVYQCKLVTEFDYHII